MAVAACAYFQKIKQTSKTQNGSGEETAEGYVVVVVLLPQVGRSVLHKLVGTTHCG
jgi:hypothetical protein